MSGRRAGPARSPCLAGAGILVAVALSACSRGGEVRKSLEIRPGQTEGTATAEVIGTQGGRILRCLAEARSDIHRDYLLRAEGDIDLADRMLDSIEQSSPTAEAKQRVWIARRHLEYEQTQDAAGDLVPIYTAVERLESLIPADSIRDHLDRTKRHLEKGDREAARRELARAGQELLFVAVDLPLSSTRRRLAEAREALAMGVSVRANAALQQAEEDLAFLTASARSPLGAARWSLVKALAVYTEGDTAGAEQYVTLARQSLEQGSDNASEATRATAKAVARELRGLEGRLDSHKADASEKLERMVDRLRVLAYPG